MSAGARWPLMAGRGPAPDPQRVRRGTPARGEWTPSPDGGWQHPLPEPPPGITAHSLGVWESWFRSWWAANWTLDDLPQLHLVIRLYDGVMRGDLRRLPELRQWLDSMGITPKGRQDRRWTPPLPPRPAYRGPGWYDHLRLTDDRPHVSAKERFAAMRDEPVHPSAKERLRAMEAGRRLPSARERFRDIEAEHDARRTDDG